MYVLCVLCLVCAYCKYCKYYTCILYNEVYIFLLLKWCPIQCIQYTLGLSIPPVCQDVMDPRSHPFIVNDSERQQIEVNTIIYVLHIQDTYIHMCT